MIANFSKIRYDRNVAVFNKIQIWNISRRINMLWPASAAPRYQPNSRPNTVQAQKLSNERCHEASRSHSNNNQSPKLTNLFVRSGWKTAANLSAFSSLFSCCCCSAVTNRLKSARVKLLNGSTSQIRSAAFKCYCHQLRYCRSISVIKTNISRWAIEFTCDAFLLTPWK